MGDTLDVSIWKHHPPYYLVQEVSAGVIGAASMNAQGSSFLLKWLRLMERIQIPFAGMIQTAGRTAPEIQREIEARLSRKANKPQALVR